MSENTCPVCQFPLERPSEEGTTSRVTRFDCEVCGAYSISKDVLLDLKNSDKTERDRTVLSYALHQRRRGDEIPHLESHTVKKILEQDYLPGPFEQANILFEWICDHVETIGSSLYVDSYRVRTLCGAINSRDILYIIDHLDFQGLVSAQTDTGGFNVSVTFAGWQHLYEHVRTAKDSRQVFMAMHFNDKVMDDAFEKHWQPAVAQTGFHLFRIDKKPEAGSIINAMRSAIRKSRFVLADLTDENQGAYWEAGFAEGMDKPVVYLCRQDQFEDTKTHFDVNQQQTVVWDPKNLQDAAERLKLVIRNTLPTEAKMEDD